MVLSLKSADQDQLCSQILLCTLQCSIVFCTDCHSLTLPNYKILDGSKLKPFAGDKINVAYELKFVLERVENIVGKGENAGYQKRFPSQGC